MLKISNKQEKIRRYFYKNEIYNLTKKIIKPALLKISSIKIRQYLTNISPSNFKYTRTKTICLLTGRSRSVYRFFRLSRLKIRKYAKAGYFIGIKKAQW